MTTEKIIILARKHLGGTMESSARLCLADAIRFQDSGELDLARMRAVESLRYSVGVFHKDFVRASR